MLYLDEDADGRTYPFEAGTMTIDDLENRLEWLGKSSIQAYIVTVNSAKANFPSRVIQSYIEGFDARLGMRQPALGSAPSKWFYRRCANFQALFNQGIDSNAVLLDGARKLGVSPWIGIRMNDIHNGDDPANCHHTRYWREHPELWCAGLDHPWDNTFNYALPVVRKRMLDFIAEVLERYNGDALQLDYLRWPSYVPFGEGPKQAPVLTQFMREVRELCRKAETQWGHPIRLVARVPLTPANALKLGLDAVTWAREGITDELIIGTFRRSMGFDAPVEVWHAEIGNADYPIALSIDDDYATMPGPFTTAGGIAPRYRTDAPALRGVASAAYQRGAHAIDLFNYMGYLNDGKPEEFQRCIFHDAVSPESLLHKERIYRVSWDDSDLRISEIQQIAWHPGYWEKWIAEREKNHVPWIFALPRRLDAGAPAEDFTLHTGPEPEPEAQPTLEVLAAPGATAVKLEAAVNGTVFAGVFRDGRAELPFPAQLLRADANRVSLRVEEGNALVTDVAIRLRFPAGDGEKFRKD